MPEPMAPQEKKKYWGIILIVLSVLSLLFGQTSPANELKHVATVMMMFIGGIAYLVCSRR